ncbi:hypothetical protein DR950_11005 [Kitasatospora xanthocidica]|uniref:Peptidyl-prolyl cis-trans isomerase n=1 Tax=Kitasatospora xanthocidica TaxID=83382 RepID=A0A372ZSQ8_9ACTN|nr:hypothetical protein [Kitasatospora xanthocidica]RGD58247.1 hypothetical protein DR950_11005 [Kitasatospora xanthocidica]
MTLGLLDGRPLPRAALDHRLAALRNGPRATALPQPGSSEGRQLTRWVAQVLLTEALCEAVAAERDLPVVPDGPARLDQQAAVELGSITAAAYEGNAAVRAVYDAVTADIDPSPEDIAHYRTLTARPATESWHLALPDGELEADPTTLPAALAEALRTAPPGAWVTTGPWTAALLATHTTQGGMDPTPTLRAAARRAAFVRWLDHERAQRLTLVDGLEHPGDPAQPDNHHRH